MQTAIALIARRGYKFLTTKNLARELKLTEAALYRHFASKADLIAKILSYFETLSCRILAEIETSDLEPLARIHRFVRDRYELFAAHPDLAKVMFSEELFQYDPSSAGQMNRITGKHREAMLNYLREAQDQGVVDASHDPEQLFRVIVGSMRFIVIQWNLGGQGFDLMEEGDKLFQTIKKLMEVRS
ncbi:MAG: TetR/AcrR family transcriptional regulator [Candidatus Cloacimonetes bacterium]|nr:TetR/AcrR family transcriptional regulator [Candidatus Cloacimonadota bacterium]